ncbi:MAG: alanine racemase [Halobacteriales archaeon]
MIEFDTARQLFRGRDMPLAFVDLEAFDSNADDVEALAGDLDVRVVTKSLRCRWLIDRVMEREGFTGLMCYSGYEAAWLAEDHEDVMVAYPVWNTDEIRRAAEADVTLTVDSREHVDRVADVGDTGVCVDLDVSSSYPGLHFGVHRSSLDPSDVVELARYAESQGLEVRGVMGYDAQIAGLPDRSPAQNSVENFAVRTLKRRSWGDVVETRRRARELMEEAGFDVYYNGGGSGSLARSTEDDSLTEVAVGSAFYMPALFDHHDDVEFEPSAGYAVEVVRRPRDDVYTCRGGGYVASGGGEDRQPVFVHPATAEATREAFGEVQTPVRYEGDLSLGDPVVLRHAKAGELCERFDDLLVVDDGDVDVRPTYRGEGRCFM